MRMRFDEDDEAAFAARRDELGERFATWLATQRVAADPNDAGLLMDWKFGYGDGFLDFWTVADVEDFLLRWCPRKLSAPPQECAGIPLSVAAFVEFLAHTGLLASRSDPPSRIRRFCEKNTKRFVRQMGNPANFGLAKSIFGGLGGPPPQNDAQLAGLLEDLVLDEDDEESAIVGPVRPPDKQERRDAIRAAAVPRPLRLLAEFCAPPGRPLTGKGNLRLADARYLVESLGTGDDPEFGGYRKLSSTTDLPGLSWLFELALEAGVVRRKQGKLLAVARFAGLEELDAYEKVVRAAVTTGLSGPTNRYFPILEPVQAAADACVVGLLADLLDAPGGMQREALVDSMEELLGDLTPRLPAYVGMALPGWVTRQVDRLAALGVVAVDGDSVTLTPAGVPVAVDLVRKAGAEVVLRADPATADAAAIADLIGMVEEQEWAQDATGWLTAQPERDTGLDQLVAELCAEHREALVVMAGLNAVSEVAPEGVLRSAHLQLGGPHDGLVLTWLGAAPSTRSPSIRSGSPPGSSTSWS